MMEKTRVLLIDDERKLCEMLKRRLELSGKYAVTVAYSGAEGIQQAKAATFDVVMTDVRMPGIDGNAVVNTLKTLRRGLPVLLRSVYYDDPDTITPETLSSVDGVICKPIDMEQLLKTIEDVVAQRPGRG